MTGVAATGWHYGDGTSSPELGGGDWKTEEEREEERRRRRPLKRSSEARRSHDAAFPCQRGAKDGHGDDQNAVEARRR